MITTSIPLSPKNALFQKHYDMSFQSALINERYSHFLHHLMRGFFQKAPKKQQRAATFLFHIQDSHQFCRS